MNFIEILKAIFLGIVEGITEWLPISSTGHMILVDELMQLNLSDQFKSMFFVVIQLGAILAVVVLYWKKLFPLNSSKKIDRNTIELWGKIIVACVPAGVIGILFDDYLEAHLHKPLVIAAMLIIYGVLFIIIENRNKGKRLRINSLKDISYKIAIGIGIFQILSLIPGTSRSGATIIGGILLGVSRTIAAEFTFFLAIPVMFGASFIKLLKFGFSFQAFELVILLVGMVTAFLVSILAIKFLMGYIKKHDFKVFGWYRIALGILVILFFTL
ncbi:undecaprenyl-diphosphate phosphatase [Alloiococcus sp. CFN-8]|uniref:undecaprenyl-diphosphate phosphatase n=1 Tax=Alloiococcus sp. CFN-8 TaxID=3416081 RepID=UPI003CE7A381